MLVASSGNTALQSVMPAIGREIGIADFWVAIAYTWSAVLWVALAPYWAEKSDHHGRKTLTMMGVSGFIVVDALVRACAVRRASSGWIGGALTFGLFAIFRGDLRRASAVRRRRRPRPISHRRRGAAGAWRRCRRCRHRSASARSSARRSRPCSCFRSSASRGRCSRSRPSRWSCSLSIAALASQRPLRASRSGVARDELSLAGHHRRRALAWWRRPHRAGRSG